jgi:hydroxymethylpyrimidine pyrophosphatase-like HAD family hydrolase
MALPAPQPQASRRALVALDVDGTLIGWDGTMSPAVRAAVADVVAAGHHVVLATGRSVVSVQGVARRLGIEAGPAVCSNGAVTVQLDPASPLGYEFLDVRTFDPGPALRAIRSELPDAAYGVEDVGRGFFITKPFPEGEIEGEHVLVDFEELCRRPATRVIIRSPEHTKADFHAIVGRLGLHEVSYAVGWVAWLDLNPLGVSKATGLEAVRRHLGVDPADTIAVGDGYNDLEMLRWAGRGVAMGNADDVVRAAADEVTGSVADDGVVPVLRALLG